MDSVFVVQIGLVTYGSLSNFDCMLQWSAVDPQSSNVSSLNTAIENLPTRLDSLENSSGTSLPCGIFRAIDQFNALCARYELTPVAGSSQVCVVCVIHDSSYNEIFVTQHSIKSESELLFSTFA